MNRQISNQRKFILVFSLVGIISIFLSWFNVTIFAVPKTVNGFETTIGKFLFILFIVCAITSFVGSTGKNIHLDGKIIIIFCSVISLLFLLFLMLGSSTSTNASTAQPGFYICLLSTISILVSTVIFRSSATKKSAITYTQVPTKPDTIIISDTETSTNLNSETENS